MNVQCVMGVVELADTLGLFYILYKTVFNAALKLTDALLAITILMELKFLVHYVFFRRGILL